jgi:hypothetical protein
VTLARRATAAVLTALAVAAGAAVPQGAAAAVVVPPRAAVLAAQAQGTAVQAADGSRTLTLRAAPTTVASGRTATLSGRLTDLATGDPVAGDPVRLETKAEDGGWLELALLTTDADGTVSVERPVAADTAFRLHHGESGAPAEAMSPELTVSVRTLTAGWGRDGVRLGRPATVQGGLAAPPGARLRLERRVGGRWTLAARTRTAADGAYSVKATTSSTGFSRWRVVRPSRGDRPAVAVRLPRLDTYRLHRYTVTTRGSVRGVAGFREGVAAILDDPRGWERAHRRFREVRHGGDFTVVLSQAGRLPGFSSVCSTRYSCRVGRYVVINQDRWRSGSPYFPGTLEQYRQMVVNHETGHWLGRGHAYCQGRGRAAPVMQQQSKGMQGCEVNPWPLAREARAVR